MVLPDAQNYSQYYPQILDSQTRWVTANVAAQNIKLTIGVGDIVNTATDPIQWANAVNSIGILDRTPVEHRRTS